MSYDTATHSIMRLFLKVVSRSGPEASCSSRFVMNVVLDMNSRTKQTLIRVYVSCFAHIKYHEGAPFVAYLLEACLVPPNFQLWYYAKRRFPVTSNLRYMHGVLNVDEIKN